MSFVKLRKSPPPHSLLLRVLIMNECWICRMKFLHMLIWSSNFSSLGCWCDGLWKWKWKVKVKVTQSCLTLCDPMDYLVHGILQVRILGWVAFPFSRGSSQPSDWTQASHIAGGVFTVWATREGPNTLFLTLLALSPTTGGKQLTQSEYYMGTQGLGVFWFLDLEWVETG